MERVCSQVAEFHTTINKMEPNKHNTNCGGGRKGACVGAGVGAGAGGGEGGDGAFQVAGEDGGEGTRRDAGGVGGVTQQSNMQQRQWERRRRLCMPVILWCFCG